MLPKENCLKAKKDFERILKEGESYKEDFLFLKMIKNNLKESRFGFIISQKISKKATLRNKVRRRLREIIKRRLDDVKKGDDVLIIARPGLEKKDFWEIEESLNKLFLRAKIF